MKLRAREKIFMASLLFVVALSALGLPASAATIVALDNSDAVIAAPAQAGANINLNLLLVGADSFALAPTAPTVLTAALDESAVPVLNFDVYLTGYDTNVNLAAAKRAAVEVNTFAAIAAIRVKEGDYRHLARDGSKIAAVLVENTGKVNRGNLRPAPVLKV